MEVPKKGAEPPRQPSIDDRRVIIDALEEAYDVPARRYRGSLSDKSLAERLKRPEKWVADLRELLFGPNVNEAHDKWLDAVAALEARVDGLSTLFAEEMAAIRREFAALDGWGK